MTFGEKLKGFRRRAGFTQKELGQRIGKGTSTVQKYELNIIFPPIDVLRRLSDILDVPIYSFVEDTSEDKRVFATAAAAIMEQNFADEDREYICERLLSLNAEGVDVAADYVDYLLTKPKYTITGESVPAPVKAPNTPSEKDTTQDD